MSAAWRLVLVFLALSGAACSRGQTVVRLTLHDTIQPITAGYLERGLRYAADTHADAVLLSLGTPGGLLDATRQMVSAIERSPVPVIVYVEPTGARAGSAGFFLLEAADVAAMAPGTNAGAAHPVLEGRTMDPVMKKKLEEDTSAFLRSITGPRGRNGAAATAGVIDAKSYTADEARQAGLIDVVAPSETALLTTLNGRSIRRFDGSSTVLRLNPATVMPLAPSLRERLLTRLANPDVAVLLFFAGLLLIYVEFHVPGTVIPGALGALCVALALFALNLLPIHATAVFLLVAAFLLIVLEIKFSSHGVLAVAGIASLVFGLLTLVDGPAELRVHTSTAIAVGVGLGGITFLLLSIAMRARRNKSLTGAEAMVGLVGLTKTTLAPAGQVEVRGELWKAELPGGAAPVPTGRRVVVDALHGLVLRVRPLP